MYQSLDFSLQSCFLLTKKATRRFQILFHSFSYFKEDLAQFCLNVSKRIPVEPDVAIVIHAYYEEELEYIFKKILNLPSRVDVFVSCRPEFKSAVMQLIQNTRLDNRIIVHVVPNIGRDVYPFINIVKMDLIDKYQVIFKIHTKRSSQRWFKSNIDALIGNQKTFLSNIEKLLRNPNSMVGHPIYRYSSNLVDSSGFYAFNDNQITSFVSDKSLQWSFFAGTMFAVDNIFVNKLKIELKSSPGVVFENESCYGTHSLAHYYERQFGYILVRTGGHMSGTNVLDYFDFGAVSTKLS